MARGFPLLVTPGGGLNSRVSNWPTAVFNAMEAFKDDFRCITMDQRNANGGESTGPIPANDPWSAFADDQLGLMDYLDLQKFFYMGYCIGGSFGLKLIERAPDRVVAAVLCGSRSGIGLENPDVMYNWGRDVRAPELRARRPEITTESIEADPHNLYRVRPDFVYSVSREFVRSCQTPILVMPDDTPAHPNQMSVDIAALAPKAQSTVFPWREPKDLLEKTIGQVRDFLRSYQPVTAGREQSQGSATRWAAPPRARGGSRSGPS